MRRSGPTWAWTSENAKLDGVYASQRSRSEAASDSLGNALALNEE
jgi:hypothetical protein